MELIPRTFSILLIFYSKFYFLDSFQIIAAVSGDPVLYNLELTVHIIIFPLKLIRFHGGVGLSVCWVLQGISYAIGGR